MCTHKTPASFLAAAIAVLRKPCVLYLQHWLSLSSSYCFVGSKKVLS